MKHLKHIDFNRLQVIFSRLMSRNRQLKAKALKFIQKESAAELHQTMAFSMEKVH